MSQALERVRQAAKARKKERFTALLHHVNIDLLRLSFVRSQATGGTRRGRRDVAGLRGKTGEQSPRPSTRESSRGAYRAPTRAGASTYGQAGRAAAAAGAVAAVEDPRLSNAQWWRCSTPSTRRTFWVSAVRLPARSVARMMALHRCADRWHFLAEEGELDPGSRRPRLLRDGQP